MRWSKEHERSRTWRWTGRWPTGRWPCRSGRERFRWRRRSISWFLKMFDDFHLMNMGISKIGKYCWWKKSCTTQHVWYPVDNGLFTISTGAGFLPSTVSISSLLITWRNPIQKPPFFWYRNRVRIKPASFFFGNLFPKKIRINRKYNMVQHGDFSPWVGFGATELCFSSASPTWGNIKVSNPTGRRFSCG